MVKRTFVVEIANIKKFFETDDAKLVYLKNGQFYICDKDTDIDFSKSHCALILKSKKNGNGVLGNGKTK